jgi:hypothetical protein
MLAQLFLICMHDHTTPKCVHVHDISMLKVFQQPNAAPHPLSARLQFNFSSFFKQVKVFLKAYETTIFIILI